ncbi:unnamed protein product [Acanthoscelides obtectus]|uniref:Uncharacterized protein n=1 Tax=Acanthoscelides obtectus TaxID=200917 RepID=A0A9P0VU54_ACAOB|nr:unnamed protein product [Acanthoscelides obtectus]CAK1685189.1 hypothetical protein AOBTE_LOCUS35254 [Acanthoscelides obtectus]
MTVHRLRRAHLYTYLCNISRSGICQCHLYQCFLRRRE